MARPYIQRLRELHRSLAKEQNLLKRLDILDRMLFVIEAQVRLYNLDKTSSDFHGQTDALEMTRRDEEGPSAQPTLPGYLKLTLELQSRLHREMPEKFA